MTKHLIRRMGHVLPTESFLRSRGEGSTKKLFRIGQCKIFVNNFRVFV